MTSSIPDISMDLWLTKLELPKSLQVFHVDFVQNTLHELERMRKSPRTRPYEDPVSLKIQTAH